MMHDNGKMTQSGLWVIEQNQLRGWFRWICSRRTASWWWSRVIPLMPYWIQHQKQPPSTIFWLICVVLPRRSFSSQPGSGLWFLQAGERGWFAAEPSYSFTPSRSNIGLRLFSASSLLLPLQSSLPHHSCWDRSTFYFWYSAGNRFHNHRFTDNLHVHQEAFALSALQQYRGSSVFCPDTFLRIDKISQQHTNSYIPALKSGWRFALPHVPIFDLSSSWRNCRALCHY